MNVEQRRADWLEIENKKMEQIQQKRQEIIESISELPSLKRQQILKNLDEIIKIAFITYIPSND
jgi:gluconate kinase